MKKVKVTEYLTIDLEKEMWCCDRCEAELVSARQPYFEGCLVCDRPAEEVYGAPIKIAEGQLVHYAPDPKFNRVIEFYCPQCGTMLEVQYLLPGHPIPVDIAFDIDAMKVKFLKE